MMHPSDDNDRDRGVGRTDEPDVIEAERAPVTLDNLASILNALPRLGEAEADAFASDIERARESLHHDL